jgi:hypothetical protein
MSYTLIFEIFCVFPPCFFSSFEFLFSLRDESDDGLEFPDKELVPEVPLSCDLFEACIMLNHLILESFWKSQQIIMVGSILQPGPK